MNTSFFCLCFPFNWFKTYASQGASVNWYILQFLGRDLAIKSVLRVQCTSGQSNYPWNLHKENFSIQPCGFSTVSQTFLWQKPPRKKCLRNMVFFNNVNFFSRPETVCTCAALTIFGANMLRKKLKL